MRVQIAAGVVIEGRATEVQRVIKELAELTRPRQLTESTQKVRERTPTFEWPDGHYGYQYDHPACYAEGSWRQKAAREERGDC